MRMELGHFVLLPDLLPLVRLNSEVDLVAFGDELAVSVSAAVTIIDEDCIFRCCCCFASCGFVVDGNIASTISANVA